MCRLLVSCSHLAHPVTTSFFVTPCTVQFLCAAVCQCDSVECIFREQLFKLSQDDLFQAVAHLGFTAGL